MQLEDIGMKETEAFYSCIKQQIKKKNTTQGKVAKACGISLGTFKGWMAKDIYPTVLDAYNIARVLGVSVEYLLTGKDRQAERNEKRVKIVRDLLDQAKEKLDKIE
jgi:transcriptional regulator with XRE-family HTH domain